ncbi:MAG TPA: RagB/SusD family nutrient uptake outer membrane protein [Bacteroidales bacterium]|nr:RagB/SusD family nutrient uptake outer membrane protein [Bacteroidales bacterium]
MTVSCSEDFLDIKPFGSLSETTLSTEAGLNNLLIGAYSVLANGSYLLSNGVIRGTDDECIGTETGVSTWNAFMYTIDAGNGAWVHYYSGVLRCNEVLKLLPKVQNIPAANALQIEAEARFLRAHYYFELVKLFRNIPWIDETISYGEKNYLVPNTVDIYPKIEADMKFAADNLTETKGQVGRANKWAAKCYLAKVYMFQHKFALAKPLLEEAIANGKTSNNKKYALQAEYNLNFIQRGKNSAEAVFTAQMDISDLAKSGNGNPMKQYNGTYGGPATCCYGWSQPTFDAVDAYQTDSETGLPLTDTYMNTPVPHDNGLTSAQPFTPYTGTLDSRLDWCVGRRGIPYRDWGVHPGKAWVRNQFNAGPYNALKNIVEQARKATDQGNGGASNNPFNIIRFADVLLWAAECEVEIGSLAKAEEYVNIVRARAADPVSWVKKYKDNAKPLDGFTDEPAANYKVGLYTGQFAANGKSYARKAVQMERRLELAMEDHRFFDMVRWDGYDFNIVTWINAYMARDGVRYLNTNNNYLKGATFEKPKHLYLPIPLTQIDLSYKEGQSVLVQNPGW